MLAKNIIVIKVPAEITLRTMAKTNLQRVLCNMPIGDFQFLNVKKMEIGVVIKVANQKITV